LVDLEGERQGVGHLFVVVSPVAFWMLTGLRNQSNIPLFGVWFTSENLAH